MTCRHRPGDPACGQNARDAAAYEIQTLQQKVADLTPKTPDASNYEVVDVLQVGRHLIMKVQYPNCAKCSYEGLKIMVFLNCTALDAIRWRKIDPHFRDKPAAKAEAPGPAARFPASEEGWLDALEYAERKKQCSPF